MMRILGQQYGVISPILDRLVRRVVIDAATRHRRRRQATLLILHRIEQLAGFFPAHLPRKPLVIRFLRSLVAALIGTARGLGVAGLLASPAC
jgi:hypothetical protein